MNEQVPFMFWGLSGEAWAIIVSAVVAIGVGLLTVLNQSQTTRLRMTFETINHKNWDRDYLEKRDGFVAIRDSGRSLGIYADKKAAGKGKENKEDHLAKAGVIRAFLNDYENIAIGIRSGILDEEFLFRYMRSAVISDWEKTSPYVIALRSQLKLPEAYVEFEGLASQWQNNRSYRKPNKILTKGRRVVTVK